MRILHATSSLAAGAATMISWLTRMQVASGHEVHLCYAAESDFRYRLANGWRYNKFYLSHLEGHYPWLIRRTLLNGDASALRQLRFFIRVLKPDILHLHCSKAGLVGRIAGTLAGVPTIYQPHCASFYWRSSSFLRALYRSAERILGYLPATIVACSESEGDQLRAAGIRCVVIRNAVDFSFIDDLVMSQHNSISPATPFSVAILGMVKFQRMPDLVGRIAQMSPADWRWRWIGGGAPEDLRFLGPRVEVTGWLPREQAIRELLSADVVLHASRWEGMPNALLEAMAVGKPIVVSDVVGTRDVIDHERDGLLIREVELPEPYLAALKRLWSNPDLRLDLARAAASRVRRDHDCRAVARQWEELYASLSTRAGMFDKAQTGLAT